MCLLNLLSLRVEYELTVFENVVKKEVFETKKN